MSATAKQATQAGPGTAESGAATSSVIWRSEGEPSTHSGRRAARRYRSSLPWLGLRRRAGPFMASRLLAVPDLGQVADVGPRPQLAEDQVVPWLFPEPGEAARRITAIAEHDGLGGAGLLAGRLDVPLRHRPALLFGRDLGRLHALHTQRALLHHPAGAHHHVGVEHHGAQGAVHVVVEAFVLRVLEPVEAPHLVRAVVLAVPGADAAVVDLLVDPVRAVDGGEHRADRLAGRVVAVLAHHGLEHGVGIFRAPAVVAVQADPVHLAPAAHLVLADHGDVVLGLAGHHAG